jgi:membrane protease YdiL (CAAX protease family)
MHKDDLYSKVKKIAAGPFPWLFFILTYSLSWMIWIPTALGHVRSTLLLVALGACVPSLMGIAFTYLTKERAAIRDFWRRTGSFKQISSKWYLVIVLVYPVAMGIAMALDRLLGGSPLPMTGAWGTLTHPLSLLTFILMMVVGGPLSEELGWRGFAIERLQSRWSALTSTLILGSIHFFWHLPLFFLQGTSQAAMGFGTPLFWLMLVQVLAHTTIYHWIYNNNGRSILAAILLHFTGNFTFTILAQLGNSLPFRVELFYTGVLTTLAVGIVAVYGPKTFVRKKTRLNSDGGIDEKV